MNVASILAFRLVTADPDRLVAFYTGIGFSAAATEPIGAGEMAMLALPGAGTRRPLQLGGQRLDLDCFESRGAPYPNEVAGNDARFQHLAIVTDDAAAAWGRAKALGASPISSGGPVTLPVSSGGVTAIKFRDPEGHPLEFLQFPHARGSAGHGLLGIDHSAISVADGPASCMFYERWGLNLRLSTLNHGSAQALLDGFDDAVVDVLPMHPRSLTPHLELLAYRVPAFQPERPWAANDIAATRVVWRADWDGLVRDPDCHLHHLTTEEG